jgi:hypothetical protein
MNRSVACIMAMLAAGSAPAFSAPESPASRQPARVLHQSGTQDAFERFGALMNVDFPITQVDQRSGRYRYEGTAPCKTRYRLELDAGTVDGKPTAAGVYHYAIDWREVVSARTDPALAGYVTLTHRNGSLTSLRVPPAQREVALGLARELIAQCAKPAAASPAPSPAPSPSASAQAAPATASPPRLDSRWRFINRDASGIIRCSYDMDPVSILVTEGMGFKLRVETGVFGGANGGPAEPQNVFSIDFVSGPDRVISYQSVFAVTLPGKSDRNIVDMRVLLDGNRFSSPLSTRHYVSGDSHVFMGSFNEGDAARFGDAFLGARLMQWQLIDKSGGAVYEKVINLYWLPRVGEVLNASQWRCPAN